MLILQYSAVFYKCNRKDEVFYIYYMKIFVLHLKIEMPLQ